MTHTNTEECGVTARKTNLTAENIEPELEDVKYELEHVHLKHEPVHLKPEPETVHVNYEPQPDDHENSIKFEVLEEDPLVGF